MDLVELARGLAAALVDRRGLHRQPLESHCPRKDGHALQHGVYKGEYCGSGGEGRLVAGGVVDSGGAWEVPQLLTGGSRVDGI